MRIVSMNYLANKILKAGKKLIIEIIIEFYSTSKAFMKTWNCIKNKSEKQNRE